ncbi:MAG: murein biosynthesis integral membrane protein MurJ [Thermodesulfovibrionales bacterium]|nr:murein biosynthesis integral membrane protein MurJ [Thermodesulfovibrionales bacterium]
MADTKKRITVSAFLMSFATFLSRISGYIKDMVLAGFFGASLVADTFFVAFRIPNLLRELFAEGSMSSAFIPVLTEQRALRGDEEAKKIVRIVFTFVVIIVGALSLLGILFAPFIVKLIAPGFIPHREKFDLTVLLTRIMFPFLLFISLASLVMGALNVKKVFFIPAFAPVMLNLSIIICLLLFGPYLSPPIISVAIGVSFGGLLQFIFQIPSFFKQGYDLRPEWDFKHEALKKIALLLVPSTMAMAVSQINIFISTILASFLKEGSITYLYYAMRLIQFPIGIFGVAMGMAVLPFFSEHASRGEYGLLKKDFSFAIRLLFFITIPAMIGLIALRVEIIEVLFERGRFTHHDTLQTAYALLFYSLGIWSIVGVRIMTAFFYSVQDTKTPVKIAATGMVINIISSIILMRFLEHGGLALANSLASWSNIFLLYYFLIKRFGSPGTSAILSSTIKILIASMLMAFFVRLIYYHSYELFGIKIFSLLLSIATGFGFYITITYMLKSEEFLFLKDMLKKRRQK